VDDKENIVIVVNVEGMPELMEYVEQLHKQLSFYKNMVSLLAPDMIINLN
jgi:hypothetical protein